MTTQANTYDGSTHTLNGTRITAEDRNGIAISKFASNARWIAKTQEQHPNKVGSIVYDAEEAYMARFGASTYISDFGGNRIATWTECYLNYIMIRRDSQDAAELADQKVEEIYGNEEARKECKAEFDSNENNAMADAKERKEFADSQKKDETDDESETEDDYLDERQAFEHDAQETGPDEDACEYYRIGGDAARWLDYVYGQNNTDEAVADGKKAYLAALRRSDSPAIAGAAAIARWYKRQETEAAEGTKEREERLDAENEEKGGTTLASGCRITAEDRNRIAGDAFTKAATWIARSKAVNNVTDPDDITKVYWAAENAYATRFNGSEYTSETASARVNTWTGEYLAGMVRGDSKPEGNADAKETAIYGPR